MAITQAKCPKCGTSVYAAIERENEVVRKDCPRCNEPMELCADERAIMDLREEREADEKRDGGDRFEKLVEEHSSDVEEIIEEIKQAYIDNLAIMNSKDAPPELGDVSDDIERSLHIIEDNILNVEQIAEAVRTRKGIKDRVRGAAESKAISAIASKWMGNDTAAAQAIYDVAQQGMRIYRQKGELTEDDVFEIASQLKMTEQQHGIIRTMLADGRFNKVLNFIQ